MATKPCLGLLGPLGFRPIIPADTFTGTVHFKIHLSRCHVVVVESFHRFTESSLRVHVALRWDGIIHLPRPTFFLKCGEYTCLILVQAA